MASQVHKSRKRRKAWPAAHLHHSRGNDMKNLLKRLWREEEGQDLVEYGLLVVLIALGAIIGMNALATDINAVFTSAGTTLNTTT